MSNCCSCSASTDTSVPASCPSESRCPVEATLGLVGGKYKALILWKLIPGAMRFSELRRAVPAATPKMLTQQLRELEEDGLVHRDRPHHTPRAGIHVHMGNGLSGTSRPQSLLFHGASALKRRVCALNRPCRTIFPAPRHCRA